MVSPHGHVSVEIVLARQVQQIRIESSCRLLAGGFCTSTTMRIVSQDLLGILDPLVSGLDVGCNGAKVGAHPVNDL